MTDPHPSMNALAASRDRTQQPFRALCYAPFTQLSFDPTGAVSVCCLSRFAPLGNIAERTLRELWTGPEMAAYRATLQRDEWPEGCAMCRWELEGGNVAAHPLRDFDTVPIASGLQWPTRLEFALSNRCNLACIHCRAELSSTIAKREGKPPMPEVYGERFFTELADFLPHATHLNFLGGEPFLQEECYRIWEMLIERDLRPSVFVTTNGTVWHQRVERILARLPMDVAVSLDGVQPRTIGAIRALAQPEIVLRNMRRFRDRALSARGGVVPVDGHLIQLNFCLMRRNWRELGDFFLLAEELACRIWATPVVWPPERSLFTLPARVQRAIAAALQRQSARVLPALTRNRESWQGLLAVVAAEAHKATRTEWANRPSVMPDAWAALQRGDAEAAYHEAARATPDDPHWQSSLLMRMSLLTTHGHIDMAAALLPEAERVAPDSLELLLRRAWIRLRQGRLPEALADANRLGERLAAAPDAAEFLVHGAASVKANVLARLGDTQGAIAELDRLLALAPGQRDAVALRALLLARHD